MAIAAFAFSSLLAAPAEKKKNVLDLKESITDSHIVFPESFEADTQKMLEGWYMKNYTATDDRYKSKTDVRTNDETYRKRLSEIPAIIELPFNQIVKSYIERYTDKGRAQVAAILGLNNYYLPIFEQALEEQGLPLELKYLPMIESALNPNAVSKHGATGLWQFMLVAAKGLDMEVNSLVDERRDPYVSSRKAARFLKDLHDTYGDWSLAIAAYNCGPGTVNKAIRRAGGDPSSHDFWSIYNYLPAETRGYVPMFIAANYVMNYYPEHNISPVVPTKPLVTDTLHINRRLHFNQISGVLDIPVDELRVLNPQFRADVIPGSESRTYNLILPSQQVHAYLTSEEDIINFESEKYARRTTAEPGQMPSDYVAENPGNTAEEIMTAEDDAYAQMADAPTRRKTETAAAPAARSEQTAPAPARSSKTTTTHKVLPGESLADIAGKYGVTPEEIKSWNNLRRNSVRTGQMLRINAASQASAARTSTASRASRSEQTDAAAPASTRNSLASASARSSKAAKASKKERNSKKKKTKAAPAQPATHTVQSGDSYEKIARKYGVSVDEVKKANNAKSDLIRPGQEVKLPKKAAVKGSKKSKASKKSKKKRR